jgi:hypothetical protein
MIQMVRCKNHAASFWHCARMFSNQLLLIVCYRFREVNYFSVILPAPWIIPWNIASVLNTKWRKIIPGSDTRRRHRPGNSQVRGCASDSAACNKSDQNAIRRKI